MSAVKRTSRALLKWRYPRNSMLAVYRLSCSYSSIKQIFIECLQFILSFLICPPYLRFLGKFSDFVLAELREERTGAWKCRASWEDTCNSGRRWCSRSHRQLPRELGERESCKQERRQPGHPRTMMPAWTSLHSHVSYTSGMQAHSTPGQRVPMQDVGGSFPAENLKTAIKLSKGRFL